MNNGENFTFPDMFCTIKYERLPKLQNVCHFSSKGAWLLSYTSEKSVMIG